MQMFLCEQNYSWHYPTSIRPIPIKINSAGNGQKSSTPVTTVSIVSSVYSEEAKHLAAVCCCGKNEHL